MTIDKAIEILYEWNILSANEVDIDLRNAVSLSIEALKWINANRDGNWHRCNSPLPGETEE